MKSGKGQHHEEEEEMEEEFGGKKDATSSNNCPKDGKNTDKANAIRSKHSVTEQRRRSRINERFHILRELIPNSDKKRDTASFLLEVIQYVQYLQDKVQKYEGPFQNWNSEPTKLMPWRNSHWSMQSFPSQHHEVKSPSTSGPALPGRFDETIISMPSATHPIQQDPTENDLCRDDSRAIDHHTELANQTIVTPPPLLPILPVSLQNDRAFSHSQARLSSDGQSAEPMTCDPVKNPDELTIEGGTISISSIYNEGLLNTLTGALESTGLDLAQATISVQINLGKQSNRDLLSGLAVTQDPDNLIPSNNQSVRRFQDSSNGGNLNQSQKRVKM